MPRLYPSQFEDDSIPDPDGTRKEFYSMLTNFAAQVPSSEIAGEKMTAPGLPKERLTKAEVPILSIGAYFMVFIALQRKRLDEYIELANDYCSQTLFEAGARDGRNSKSKIVHRTEATDAHSQVFLLESHRIASTFRKILLAARTFSETN